MKNIAVLDNSWGDCGKGRIAHFFSKNYDWCIRSNGANNCGHVVYRNGKKYAHHLLPSADYRFPKTKSFLSSGMVIDLDELYNEITESMQDFPNISKSIYVDTSAFVITKENILEDKNNNKHIGSTGKGVQPAYTDKVARRGTRIYHLINDNAAIIDALKKMGVQFKPLLALKEEFEKSSLIFEGAQSILLDLNAGVDYPFVTSSDCTVSGIYSAGFNFIKLDKVFGVMKPYLTKVGNGNFPTEIFGEEAENIRRLGGEVGSTTGRNRRIGYLDLVSLKYGTIRGGINSLILTKMDILNGFEKVRVCNSYGKELFGPEDFVNITPQYIELPGWKDCTNADETKIFLNYIEEFIGVPIEYISCGVEDTDIIKWR